MKNRIFHNWTLKLISVVCAIVLWMVVYSLEDPVDYARWYDVEVELVNTEAITEDGNGKVYEILDNSNIIESLRIQASRSVIDDISEDDIHVEADFTQYKVDGTIELEFYSDKHNEEITFTASSYELKLFVEDRASTSPYITVQTVGEPEEGYIVNRKSTTQNRINVSGGKSIIERIAEAAVIVDVTDATGDISTAVDLILYDRDGAQISTERLDMSITSVDTTIEILPTKTVPIRYEISGEVAEDYTTTGEVIYGATEVQIAGRATALSRVSEIVVEGEAMSIEGAEEDIILNIDLDDYLPTGIERVDKAGSGRITVTVKVVPIIEQEFTLRASQITLENIPEDHFADLALATSEFTVVIRGAQHQIETLSSAQIRGTIDIADWMEANNFSKLGDGKVYQIVPELDLSEEFSVVFSGEIEVVAGIVEE